MKKSGFRKIGTGSHWENEVGYSRAVKAGNIIEISGTTAVDENGTIIGTNDPAEQTRFIILKAEKVLKQLGSSLDQVVRTRIFTTDISRWEEIGKVHGEFFGEIKPAATMVEVSKLIEPGLLVEIEFSAVTNELC